MAVGLKESEDVRTAIEETVLTEVRGVMPKDLVAKLSLDSSLYTLGLDSIAIMDVVNRIEKHFGMRFREEWLYDLETCADVVDCIARHANPAGAVKPAAPPPLEVAASPAAARSIPAPYYDVAQFPECVAFHQRLASAAAAGLENPFFRTS